MLVKLVVEKMEPLEVMEMQAEMDSKKNNPLLKFFFMKPENISTVPKHNHKNSYNKQPSINHGISEKLTNILSKKSQGSF